MIIENENTRGECWSSPTLSNGAWKMERGGDNFPFTETDYVFICYRHHQFPLSRP